MKNLPSPLFRGLLVLALTFGALAGAVHAVSAANGAFTWQNVTDTFVVFGSCSDPDGVYQITIVSNGVIHYVESANGYAFTWNENGAYRIEPIAADSPVTYSGRYATQLQDILSKGAFVFKNIFTNTGLGSDGTHETFHVTYHVTITPDGIERDLENFKWVCR
jgi:outer membrane protein assembly factor BamB